MATEKCIRIPADGAKAARRRASDMQAAAARLDDIRTRVRQMRAVMEACAFADAEELDPSDVLTHFCQILDSIYDDLRPAVVLRTEGQS